MYPTLDAGLIWSWLSDSQTRGNTQGSMSAVVMDIGMSVLLGADTGVVGLPRLAGSPDEGVAMASVKGMVQTVKTTTATVEKMMVHGWSSKCLNALLYGT
jgi:hypothetical protein